MPVTLRGRGSTPSRSEWSVVPVTGTEALGAPDGSPRRSPAAVPPAAQPTQLGVEVGARASLTALAGDGRLQGDQRPRQPGRVGGPAAPFALLQPVDGAAVPALGVAAAAGGDLVLDPGRAALQPRDDVLGGGAHQVPKLTATPDAGAA